MRISNISRKLLLATFTFSMMGSLAMQPLVAMKRAANDELEGHDEKRFREEVAEIQNDQQDQVYTGQDFLDAIASGDLELIGHIIDQKPEWLTSGPLKYLTKHDAEDLVDWHRQDFGRMLTKLVNRIVPDLRDVTRQLEGSIMGGHNLAMAKSLCTDLRLSSDVIMNALSWSTNYAASIKVLRVLLNDQNVNQKSLAAAFEFHHFWGCTPLHDAIKHSNIEAVTLLINSPYVTADGINHALKQVCEYSHGNHNKLFQLLINDQRVTVEGLRDAIVHCHRPDFCKVLLQDPRITVDSVNNVLSKSTPHQGSYKIVKQLLADDRINPETIDKALLNASKDCGSHFNDYSKKIIQNLLTDSRVTVDGINIALVYAAVQGNKVAFDILRADPRVTNTSPFPLQALMNEHPEAFIKVASYLGVDPVMMHNDINEAFIYAVRVRNYDGVSLLSTYPPITAASAKQALLIAVNNNDLRMIRILLEFEFLTAKEIHPALVTAAKNRNTKAFDLLRADPRVTNTSPFPLEDLMYANADIIGIVAQYLNATDYYALEHTNHQGFNLLHHFSLEDLMHQYPEDFLAFIQYLNDVDRRALGCANRLSNQSV